MRGMGRVFLRGRKFWIAYYANGEEYREPGGVTRHEAQCRLRARLREKFSEQFVGPRAEKLTVSELLDGYLADLRLRGAKAVRTQEIHMRRLHAAFGAARALALVRQPERIAKWAEAALACGAARETVKHVLGILKAAFNLARRQNRLLQAPVFPRLKGGPARQGFFERHEFLRVHKRLRAVRRRRPIDDIAEFAYLTGWRKSEILGLRWAWVDRQTRVIRLPDAKNDDGRVLPLVDDLWDLLERRWAAREYRAADRTVGIADHVFHRRGRPLTDIDWAWRSARREAGLSGKLFHDFRRTAARDLVDAGMDYRSAMSVTGHKTQAVFERYRIVDARRTAEALKAMQTHRRRMRTVTETVGRSKNTDKTRTTGHPAAPATGRIVKRNARLADSTADHRLTSLVTA